MTLNALRLVTHRYRVARIATAVALSSALAGPAAHAQGRQAARPDPLEQARVAYNESRYADAVTLATEARRSPVLTSAATVVVARAYLAQFGDTHDRADLDAAREALRSAEASALSARDRVDLLIAFGLSLYLDDEHSLDDRYSAAAEQFEVALGQADMLDASARDGLFEWWAGALDRQAQDGPEGEKQAIYRRILSQAENELRRDESSVAASYWLAAAARGASDLPRAAGAARAGWLRAGALGAPGEKLRRDLDQLMVQVILPERAKEITTDGDARVTFGFLQDQWTAFKAKWTR